MRILIAPDKFKDSLSADRVAHALLRGIRNVHPDASFAVRPIADGGEGTVEAFALALGGRIREVTVRGPLDDPVLARIASLPEGRTVVEMADASGLSSVVPTSHGALVAHSSGTGELLMAAAEGEGQVVLGIGGSASTDGGTGAARAWGWRFLDRRGEEIPLGGLALKELAHIEPPNDPSTVGVVGACDVDNPLLGERGTARIFAQQKGADTDAVDQLEEGLTRLAAVIDADLGVDVSTIEHGGAGGGMGAGLVAFFGGTLRPGLDVLAEATGLADEVHRSDIVVTGEGRLDRASLGGKAPIAIARLARSKGTPCVAIAGDLQLERRELKDNGIELAAGLKQTGGEQLARTDPERAIAKAIEGLLRHRQERKQGRTFRR
jgi:glycerate kinase